AEHAEHRAEPQQPHMTPQHEIHAADVEACLRQILFHCLPLASEPGWPCYRACVRRRTPARRPCVSFRPLGSRQREKRPASCHPCVGASDGGGGGGSTIAVSSP